MKIAIIGSRNIEFDNFGKYLPPEVTEIVSGGANGIDSCAKKFALKTKFPLRSFFPNTKNTGNLLH